MPSALLGRRDGLGRHVSARSTPILRASSQAGLADVGDHDVARADVPRDRSGHQSDRSGAGDQHVLADERETSAPCARRCRTGRRSRRGPGRSAGWCTQTLTFGEHDELGERPVPVHPDALGADAQVAPAGPAVAAGAAHDVTLAGHLVADAATSRTPAPTSTTSPQNSWPEDQRRVHGSGGPRRPTPRCAGRCRRCPVRSTRIFTSPGPASGSGRSTSSSPGRAAGLYSAFMPRPCPPEPADSC